jgi:hypothetical protein
MTHSARSGRPIGNVMLRAQGTLFLLTVSSKVHDDGTRLGDKDLAAEFVDLAVAKFLPSGTASRSAEIETTRPTAAGLRMNG